MAMIDRENAHESETLPLPRPEGLTVRQQLAIDCALCGSYIGPRGRPLGTVYDGRGWFLYLFGCAERCVLPRRTPFAAWPPDGPPTGASEAQPDGFPI